MSVKISDSWIKHLDKEFQKDYFFEIIKNVKLEYSNYKCFPKGNDIFKAFDLCSFEKIKVIIVGQDPYHGDNQANGLCFSVNKGIDCPPSLKNIFKEIHNNFGLERINPDFSDLAKQGVLLLNSVLTVRRKFPGSHKYVVWETFTDKVLEIISEKKENLKGDVIKFEQLNVTQINSTPILSARDFPYETASYEDFLKLFFSDSEYTNTDISIILWLRFLISQ